jgi:hypothetical protein
LDFCCCLYSEEPVRKRHFPYMAISYYCSLGRSLTDPSSESRDSYLLLSICRKFQICKPE